MANLKAEFHEQYDEEMNICLLESHLKMSKCHAKAVSFDVLCVDLNELILAKRTIFLWTKQLLN